MELQYNQNNSFQFCVISILILFSTVFENNTYCQNNSECEEYALELTGVLINDSLTKPKFLKSKEFLVLSFKNFVAHGDFPKINKDEFYAYVIYFDIDSAGKIVNERIPNSHYVKSEDFFILMQNLNSWEPSYQKQGSKLATNYNMVCIVRIYPKKVIIEFSNKNHVLLYKYRFKRSELTAITKT
jgi:hypothetical protein